MRYLLLNGSPKAEKSVTMIVAERFLKGIRSADADADIRTFHLAEMEILPCRSCYGCWSHLSRGECFLSRKKQDDMNKIMEVYRSSRKFILVTPLHFFGISSYLQKFLERTMPLIKPNYIHDDGEEPEDMSVGDITVIATCKCEFPGVWDSVLAQMKALSRGKGQMLFSSQPLPSDQEGVKLVENYLGAVEEAGADFARQGVFSEAAREKLRRTENAMAEKVVTYRMPR